MTKGCKFWDDPTRYCGQRDNSLEQYLFSSGQAGFETCGPTAAVNALKAIGYEIETETPGGYNPQPEDVLFLFMNDRRNWPQFQVIRPNLTPGKLPGNRVPQYYPWSIEQVFGVTDVEFLWGPTFGNVAINVTQGRAVQLCMTKGHFVTFVAFDDSTNELVYWDPMEGGFGKRLKAADFAQFEPYYILYK